MVWGKYFLRMGEEWMCERGGGWGEIDKDLKEVGCENIGEDLWCLEGKRVLIDGTEGNGRDELAENG
ncbi:hypothetical protein, partial [Bacillus altitudinis]|uniref:hypothetical protein n=1 Tax=Bacillus altitudinis TaxID=293387 RepID=UPI001F434353